MFAEYLLDPVREFPWMGETDESAYLAAVLTLVGRHLIDGPCPTFAISAPKGGTGKSLLADVIGLVGTGRKFPTMTMTYENEELRKRVHALALAGASTVLLDNLSGSLGSDTLAAAPTASEWEDRRLGTDKIVKANLRTVWFATGNNLSYRKTMQRRVIPIGLDAKMENPEDRTGFKIPNLYDWIADRRVLLAAAALTILRAFIQAGRPAHNEGPRYGSYERWDDLIRSCIIWLGLSDPASTGNEEEGRGRPRAQSDDEGEEGRQLLEVLAAMFPPPEQFETMEVFTKLDKETEETRPWRRVLDAVAPR